MYNISNRIVIPSKLRKPVLKKLHKCHFGIEAMKMLSRSYVYWPKIDSDIKSQVERCSLCAENSKFPIKTLLNPWPKATRALERIHMDLAGPTDNIWYLVIVDAYSMVPAVYPCKNITSTTVLGHLSNYFSWFGNAETIVTDNGTQFISSEFEEFCSSRGSRHLTSPAYHPMSNGRAERFVDTLKRTELEIRSLRSVIKCLQKNSTKINQFGPQEKFWKSWEK